MQLFHFIATALAFSLVSITVSADHRDIQGRHHQGISRRGSTELLDRRATSNSKWSWYNTETGQAGACGRMLRNSEYVVAMNSAQYSGNTCYRSITLSWRGKTARAQIVDRCPGCPHGGLDLSPSLFEHFTGRGTGIIWDGTWWFDGEGPEQPRPTSTRTRTTSRWTPPPSPTSTSSRRTRTSSSRTSTTTESTSTTSSAAETTATSTTDGPVPTPTSFVGPETGNVGGFFQLAVAIGRVVVAGANAQ